MPTSFLNKNFNIILLTCVLLIIFYRSPYILLNGRFVAEEGSFWFRNSYLFGPIKGLTQTFFGSSYFNLWPNIATVFASFVPLEYSPLITVYFALSVKLYLFIFIIYSKSNFLVSNFDKLIISLLVLLSPPMVAEVWLNTITSQVYFSILTILIFFQKNIIDSFFNRISPLILFISGLTSLLPCVLSPFFIYKYLKDKNKFNLINMISITVTSIFQSGIFLYSKIENLAWEGTSTRFILTLDKITNYTYNVGIKSFFGRDLTQAIYYNFLKSINIYLITVCLIVIFVLFLILISKNIKKDNIFLFLLLFFLVNSFIAIYGSKGEEVQGRYALIPGILLIFFVFRLFQTSKKSLKFFSITLIFISLITGAYEYKFNNLYPNFLSCVNCPNWKNEVIKWKNDDTYNLKIWMYPTKSMNLKK